MDILGRHCAVQMRLQLDPIARDSGQANGFELGRLAFPDVSYALKRLRVGLAQARATDTRCARARVSEHKCLLTFRRRSGAHVPTAGAAARTRRPQAGRHRGAAEFRAADRRVRNRRLRSRIKRCLTRDCGNEGRINATHARHSFGDALRIARQAPVPSRSQLLMPEVSQTARTARSARLESPPREPACGTSR